MLKKGWFRGEPFWYSEGVCERLVSGIATIFSITNHCNNQITFPDQHKSSHGRSVRTQHDARGGHKSEPSSPDKVRRPLPDRLYDTPSDLAPSQLFIGQAKVPPPSHPQPCLILETPTESRGVGMGNFTTRSEHCTNFLLLAFPFKQNSLVCLEIMSNVKL